MARLGRWFWIRAFNYVGYENPEYRLDYPEIYADWQRKKEIFGDEARHTVALADDMFPTKGYSRAKSPD